MGPSGCGKTTLLNVLASRPTGAQKVESTVLVNGVKPSRAVFREMTCFVEQEDALIGALTVRETLNFASRLASTRYDINTLSSFFYMLYIIYVYKNGYHRDADSR